jgi:hypothetical protein
VDSLAGWDHKLLQVHFAEGFGGFFRRLGALDLVQGPDRAAAIADFVELANSFTANWQEAANLMATGRPASATTDDSPGVSPDEWRSYCLKDFGRILQISETAFQRSEISQQCEAIPPDYAQLEAEWQRYAYLFLGSPDGEAEERIAWSEGAVKVHNAVAVLRTGLASEEIQAIHDDLANTLGQGLGIRNQLNEISDTKKKETDRFVVPTEAIEKLETPELAETAPVLKTVAQLGVAERLLPPVSRFFADTIFDLDNDSLLTADRARDNVPSANDFLVWAQRELRDVSSQPTTFGEIKKIDDAIYYYVKELVDRQIDSFRGMDVGGSYFVLPRNAGRAASWRAFVDAVAQWNHIGRRSGSSSASRGTGIDAKMLDDFAQQNRRLEGMSRDLREAERRSTRSQRPQTGPVVSPTVDRAIGDFKSIVGSLDSDALAAWRELSEKPENLSQFHAFSGLGGVRYADDLRRLLEEHGAKLLVSEIEPGFRRSYQEFWRRIADSAYGDFPFITRNELEDARDMYARGYSRGERQDLDDERRGGRSRRSLAGARWSNRSSDAGRRVEAMTLELPTISHRDAENLFGELAVLVENYGLTPILTRSETMIDFVGSARPTLASLQGWAAYLVGGEESRRRRTDEIFEARLLPQYRQGDGTFLLERVNSIGFFDAERPIRSSTEQYVDVPLEMSESPVTVVGVNEDRTTGWTGRLIIEGGDFKIPYFVLVAADSEPSSDRRVWEVRVEIPAFDRSRGRLDGIFELSFDRPVPDVLPNNAGREYD